MKRIKCPKCGKPIIFDESKYEAGEKIALQCPTCGKTFGIRYGNTAKNDPMDHDKQSTEMPNEFGRITVIENVFHYKQEIPLQFGINKIGRYQKANPINIPLATDDPSVDLLHCTITVSRDKRGQLKYVLKDGPSNTGTFVDNEILGDSEQRVIEDGQLFTIGATSIILHTPQND
jgi:endogenous inhibitor of DNA gyrase (YacG/DUF329 family)